MIEHLMVIEDFQIANGMVSVHGLHSYYKKKKNRYYLCLIYASLPLRSKLSCGKSVKSGLIEFIVFDS